MKDTPDIPSGMPPVGLDEKERAVVAGWMLLAVFSLAAAGFLALMLPAARSPDLGRVFPWLDGIFQKALVTHVVMSFTVWFLAMLGGLATMVRPGGWSGRAGLALAVLGTLLLLIPVLTNQGEPLLVDYVPVLDTPLFYAGLGLLAAGVALPVVHLLARPPSWSFSMTMGIGSAGVLFLLALLCIILAWASLPEGQRFGTNDEAIFWGGGHLLQLCFTTLLLTCWQEMGELHFDRAPLNFAQWRVVCILLVASGLPGPVFFGFWPAGDPVLRLAFTKLYFIALPVPVLIAGGALLWKLLRVRPQFGSPAYVALFLSAFLFAAGGVFGIFADGLDTRTPGHYHAELIATTSAFIGLFFSAILPTLQRGGRKSRWVLAQFWFLVTGQFIACTGMFMAGAEGVGRKVSGAAQGLDTAGKILGMRLNHGGAGIASIGGIIFVVLALTRLLSSRQGKS